MLCFMLILCSLSVLSYSILANITEAVIVVYTVESVIITDLALLIQGTLGPPYNSTHAFGESV